MSDDRLFSETVQLTAEQRDKLLKSVPLEARVAEIEMRLDDVGILFLNDWCKMIEHDFRNLFDHVKDIQKIIRDGDALYEMRTALEARIKALEEIIKDGEVFDPYDDQLGMLKRINERDGHLIELMERRLSVLERKVIGR